MLKKFHNWFYDIDEHKQENIMSWLCKNPGCRQSILFAWFEEVHNYSSKVMTVQTNHLVKNNYLIKGSEEDPRYLISDLVLIELPPQFRTIKVVEEFGDNESITKLYIYLPYTQFWFVGKQKLFITHSLIPFGNDVELFKNFFFMNTSIIPNDSILYSPICLGKHIIEDNHNTVNYFWNSTFAWSELLLEIDKLTQLHGSNLYKKPEIYEKILKKD